MKIIFMGTPEFSVPSLKGLHNSDHDIVAVVTAPDKPVGRGQKVRFSPVKTVALEYSLPVFQPQNLNNSEFIDEMKNLGADLFVVVAFRILPPEVFTLPPKGTVNLHSSLLPKYRGAAPIQWAIINGERETGVTTIFIQEKVDAGHIILQRKVKIGDEETAGELHDRLAATGAELLLETVNLIDRGEAPHTPQTGEVTKAPKLTKELGEIDWRKSNEDIRNLIRGLAPKPGAYTFINGKLLKIYRAKCVNAGHSATEPGEIVEADARSNTLIVATGKGNLQILEVQPEGKRRIGAAEYLNGYNISVGDKVNRL